MASLKIVIPGESGERKRDKIKKYDKEERRRKNRREKETAHGNEPK